MDGLEEIEKFVYTQDTIIKISTLPSPPSKLNNNKNKKKRKRNDNGGEREGGGEVKEKVDQLPFFQIDYYESDSNHNDTLKHKSTKTGGHSQHNSTTTTTSTTSTTRSEVNIQKWFNSGSFPLQDIFDQFQWNKTISSLLYWDFKMVLHWDDGL